jgi:hypothetical protein
VPKAYASACFSELGHEDHEIKIIKAAVTNEKAGDTISRLNRAEAGRLVLDRFMNVRTEDDKKEFRRWTTMMGLESRTAGNMRVLAAFVMCCPSIIYVPNLSKTIEHCCQVTKLILRNCKLPSGVTRDDGSMMTHGDVLGVGLRNIVIQFGELQHEIPTIESRPLEILAVTIGKCKPSFRADVTEEEFGKTFCFWDQEHQDGQKLPLVGLRFFYPCVLACR